MKFNISAWSIRNPVPSIVLFAVLLLLGIMSFRSLPVTRFPNIDVPVISVTITQSGSAPAELESQISKQVEDSVANITGVKKIISTLTDGASVTALEFRLEINQDRALNDVKDAIAISAPICPARSTSQSSSASTLRASRSCPTAPPPPALRSSSFPGTSTTSSSAACSA